MSVSVILNALQKVKRTGQGRYVALCPVHDDRKPSMAITETTEGGVLIHCFACGANGAEVCNALGIDQSELFPPRLDNDYKNVRKKPPLLFTDRQLLECIEFETLIVALCAKEIAQGKQLSQSDAKRVETAYKRITAAVNYQKNIETDWQKRINDYEHRKELVDEFLEFGDAHGIGAKNVH